MSEDKPLFDECYLGSLNQHAAELGFTEDITEESFYIPTEAEYLDVEGEDIEEVELEISMSQYDKTKDKDYWKRWYKNKSGTTYKYENPKTGEVYYFSRKGIHKKDGVTLTYKGKAGDPTVSDPKTGACWEGYERVPNTKEGEPGSCRKVGSSKAAEYQGRKVKLNKPFRTPDGPKKFSVYVKNEKGNVVKVNFGDPNMEIKRDDPARRKSFRARHRCATPGPKWKARYWSCKNW